jgi:hypothetical protein
MLVGVPFREINSPQFPANPEAKIDLTIWRFRILSVIKFYVVELM